MSEYFRKCASPAHDFEIDQDDCSRWIARDRDGLTGGTFFTCKEAVRFALGEAGGDQTYVHLLAAGESDGRRSAVRPSGRQDVS